MARGDRSAHGTVSKHRGGCRCEPCVDAYNKQMRDYNAKRRADYKAGNVEPDHGTTRGYMIGCRCIYCRAARFRADQRAAMDYADPIVSAFIRQDGRCALCLEQVERLDIDHDHETGKFRALLCSLCNRGLGQFRDNVEVMQRAVQYVQAHRS